MDLYEQFRNEVEDCCMMVVCAPKNSYDKVMAVTELGKAVYYYKEINGLDIDKLDKIVEEEKKRAWEYNHYDVD